MTTLTLPELTVSPLEDILLMTLRDSGIVPYIFHRNQNCIHGCAPKLEEVEETLV